MMTTIVRLNNVEHHDLWVRPRQEAAAGEVSVFPNEFEEVAREYPILFRRVDDEWHAVALLGLEADENLFRRADGTWTTRYVPALVQRGPFSIGRDADAEPMIHVDLDDPRVGRGEVEGYLPLFKPQGGAAPFLDHIVEVLRRIHLGHQATAPMFAAFEEAGLIEPMKLEIDVDEAVRYDLVGFHAIAEEVLATLDDAALARLHHAGWLRCAFQVAGSLGNFRHLADAKRGRRRQA